MHWNDGRPTVRVPELDVASSLADSLEPRPVQKRQAAVGSRSDVDRSDNRRLGQIRDGSVLEVELQSFSEVVERLLGSLALTGDLDLEAAGDVPRSLVRDRSSQPHPFDSS